MLSILQIALSEVATAQLDLVILFSLLCTVRKASLAYSTSYQYDVAV